MVEKKKAQKSKSNKGRKIAIAKKSNKNLKRRKSDKKNPDLINLVDDIDEIIIYDPETEVVEIKSKKEDKKLRKENGKKNKEMMKKKIDEMPDEEVTDEVAEEVVVMVAQKKKKKWPMWVAIGLLVAIGIAVMWQEIMVYMSHSGVTF